MARPPVKSQTAGKKIKKRKETWTFLTAVPIVRIVIYIFCFVGIRCHFKNNRYHKTFLRKSVENFALFIVHCKSYALVQSFNRISAVGVKQRNRYFKKKSAHQRQKMKCIITFPFIPKILKNANNHRHRRLQNLYERVGTYIEWAMVSISCSRNACTAKTGNLRHKYKNT